jgi:hypothetical protein
VTLIFKRIGLRCTTFEVLGYSGGPSKIAPMSKSNLSGTGLTFVSVFLGYMIGGDVGALTCLIVGVVLTAITHLRKDDEKTTADIWCELRRLQRFPEPKPVPIDDAPDVSSRTDEADCQVSVTPSEPRIFVTASLFDIANLYSGRTTYQGDQPFESFKGKWMRASVFVNNVSQTRRSISLSCLVGDPLKPLKDLETEGERRKALTQVNCYFDSDWEAHTAHLKRGDRIDVIGEISEGGRPGVHLQNCEFVSR